MKILYIANARIPTEKAHGIQIMKMCEAFAEAGNEVELIIPRRVNWIKKDPFEYYGVKKNFKIKKLPCLDLIPLDRYIGHLGMWVESFTFNISVFFYLLFASNIRTFEHSNIIYTRDKLLLPFIFFKKNLIFETHGFPKNYFLYSPFLKRLKKIVVITQKLKDLFIERGIPEKKILVAPDGVDINKFKIQNSKFKIREKLGLPQDKKIVLYTGHFYEWKGAAVLLEAARNFQFPISNFQFIFVGGTEKDTKKFRQKARTLNNVMVVGHRPYTEIPYWLKAADVLALPNSGKENISKYWTSPLKLFEYMASGRPVVASDLPSIREILNEKNAILVEPDNPQSLARGIQDVLLNPQLSDKISNRALKDVQPFSWTKRAEEICQKLF